MLRVLVMLAVAAITVAAAAPAAKKCDVPDNTKPTVERGQVRTTYEFEHVADVNEGTETWEFFHCIRNLKPPGGTRLDAEWKLAEIPASAIRPNDCAVKTLSVGREGNDHEINRNGEIRYDPTLATTQRAATYVLKQEEAKQGKIPNGGAPLTASLRANVKLSKDDDAGFPLRVFFISSVRNNNECVYEIRNDGDRTIYIDPPALRQALAVYQERTGLKPAEVWKTDANGNPVAAGDSSRFRIRLQDGVAQERRTPLQLLNEDKQRIAEITVSVYLPVEGDKAR